MTDRRTVRIASAGRAQDSALLAAADVASTAAALRAEYRLVGGNAVTLLVKAFDLTARVPTRETADADFGVPYELAADPQLLPAELRARGDEQAAGNRFVRTEQRSAPSSALDLVIDILTPSSTGRLECNQPRGELVVDEVPGLQLAPARPGVQVRASAALTTGQELEMRLVLPDPLSALCLKAYAHRGRTSDRDAVDVWRLLDVAREAGITPRTGPGGAPAERRSSTSSSASVVSEHRELRALLPHGASKHASEPSWLPSWALPDPHA